jgi:hypothetical protein
MNAIDVVFGGIRTPHSLVNHLNFICFRRQGMNMVIIMQQQKMTLAKLNFLLLKITKHQERHFKIQTIFI